MPLQGFYPFLSIQKHDMLQSRGFAIGYIYKNQLIKNPRPPLSRGQAFDICHAPIIICFNIYHNRL
jgi:hypothetical protein